jgi:hypothetical protein
VGGIIIDGEDEVPLYTFFLRWHCPDVCVSGERERSDRAVVEVE